MIKRKVGHTGAKIHRSTDHPRGEMHCMEVCFATMTLRPKHHNDLGDLGQEPTKTFALLVSGHVRPTCRVWHDGCDLVLKRLQDAAKAARAISRAGGLQATPEESSTGVSLKVSSRIARPISLGERPSNQSQRTSPSRPQVCMSPTSLFVTLSCVGTHFCPIRGTSISFGWRDQQFRNWVST